MGQRQREKDVWRDIFKLYRDMPYLWKTTHDYYHNKEMRSSGMSLLFEKYKTYDEDVTLNAFKKKIENMRTSYGRERKKLMNSLRSGVSAEDVHVPTLWYYELLTFLDERDAAAQDRADGIKIIQTSCADEDRKSETTPASKRKRLSSFQKDQEEPTNEIISDKDDWEIIGGSIGVQLTDLTINQKFIARKLISDIIFYGSTGQLTNNSCLCSPSALASPSHSTVS